MNKQHSRTSGARHRTIAAGIASLVASLLFAHSSSYADSDVLHILQYHHIDTNTPRSTSTTPLLFEKHLIHLETEGYKVVRLSEAIDTMKQGGKLPDKAVAITFDDGYRSIYEKALPIIRPHGFPFTVFINPDALNSGSKEFISWDQAKELASSGAEFANHTIGHIHMIDKKPEESNAQWIQRISENVEDAEQQIQQKLGYSLKMLAYPYGEFDRELTQLIDQLGYIGFGQQSGPVGANSDWQTIPRFPLPDDYGDMNSFKEKLKTLPLYPVDTQPTSVVVRNTNPPTLTFTPSAVSAKLVACYGSGQGRINVELEGNLITVTGNQAFSSRRFRYNCTAPAGNGYFYWHSFPWINPEISD
ncbi:polysaccharide deacetylase family protein [Hahella ganghwensis]|uniref:polysaccharide deacetylase family protein n=1 Tax=Hahella ganghwensis TaxID=286420 RepID=UPI0003745167|nr:polysaccharide deacetylase family protein [Hahella ganghwensis]